MRACCARPPSAAQAVLNRVPPVALPQRRVLTQYPRVHLSPQPRLVQARTRGASKAPTTAPRRRRGSSIRRRARARPPPRARRTTASWTTMPTRGAARGAPAPHKQTNAHTHGHVNERARTVRHGDTAGVLPKYSRGTHRYAAGGGYVRLNTALGAGEPNCTLLCALPAPGAHAALTRCSRRTHAVLTPYSRGMPSDASIFHRFARRFRRRRRRRRVGVLGGDRGRGDPVQDVARVGGQEGRPKPQRTRHARRRRYG